MISAMRSPWLMLVLVACGDSNSRKAQDPEPPAGSGSATVAVAAFKPSCSDKHAPKPERDPSSMCLVPAAEFMMGTPVDPDRPEDGPARRVRISKPFYLDQLEVTNTQYARFLRAGGEGCGKPERYCFAGDQPDGVDVSKAEFPVPASEEMLPARVTVHGAEAYCAWAGKRLPTSAEWELAARHDPATGEDRRFPWGNEYRHGVTNAFEAIEPKRGRLAPVGTFPDDRSPVGVLDMGGNESEWVADCYSLDVSCASPCVDPKPTKCDKVCIELDRPSECEPGRVLRGGRVTSKPMFLASKAT
ncbi:MAG: uncharacterized protein JWP01_4277 [Myxococcales bacterium]|nr:uncharacterized protein [Myxococcales bacterium]